MKIGFILALNLFKIQECFKTTNEETTFLEGGFYPTATRTSQKKNHGLLETIPG